MLKWVSYHPKSTTTRRAKMLEETRSPRQFLAQKPAIHTRRFEPVQNTGRPQCKQLTPIFQNSHLSKFNKLPPTLSSPPEY